MRHTPEPCPFCNSGGATLHSIPWLPGKFAVCCGNDDCDATGPTRCSKRSAIAAWNGATDDSKPSPEFVTAARALCVVAHNVLTRAVELDCRDGWSDMDELEAALGNLWNIGALKKEDAT